MQPINALHRRLLASGYSILDGIALSWHAIGDYELATDLSRELGDMRQAARLKQQVLNITYQLREVERHLQTDLQRAA
jgi:hypothetical protein